MRWLANHLFNGLETSSCQLKFHFMNKLNISDIQVGPVRSCETDFIFFVRLFTFFTFSQSFTDVSVKPIVDSPITSDELLVYVSSSVKDIGLMLLRHSRGFYASVQDHDSSSVMTLTRNLGLRLTISFYPTDSLVVKRHKEQPYARSLNVQLIGWDMMKCFVQPKYKHKEFFIKLVIRLKTGKMIIETLQRIEDRIIPFRRN